MRKAVLILSWLLLAIPCRAEIIIVDDDEPAPAAILVVSPDEYPTIQAAIDDANDGDTVMVTPRTYTGPGNRDIDFHGKAITVRSVCPRNPHIVAATVIDCNDAGRGFYFHSGEEANSVLDGLTITNGYADFGGAIHIRYSSPHISNCVISNNTASEGGGGIYCRYYSPLISNCTITGNSTEFRGGGMYCYRSDPTITNCTISGNAATSYDIWGEYGGGGIYCYKRKPTITNCTVSGNSSNTDGGGMYCKYGKYSGRLTISYCTFAGNSASNRGGGMYEYRSNSEVTRCMFNGNAAQYGAGVYSNSSYPNLSSCTFTGNTASIDGGGLCCVESGPIATNCTFSSNVAASGDGGGIFGDYAWVRNCIFWDNADSGGTVESAQISSGTSSVSFSCIQDEDPNDGYIPFGGADNNNIDDYPMFVQEPNDGNDGWGDDPCTPGVDEGANDDFGDLHLQSSSPCINTGSPFTWIEPGSVDIDGQPRVMGQVVDMGADEYLIKMLIVTKPEGGEVWVAGSWHEITWESHVYEEAVFIMYITEGNNMHPVASEVPNTGSYMWHLPEAVDSNQCVVRVVPNVVDLSVVCVDSGVFTIHPDTPGPPVTSKWKSLGGDFDRMGLSENYGPELGCVKWQFEIDGAISAGVTVGPNDTVYVPCEDGNLYALDANGSLLWSYEANSPLISSPSIGPDGTAYVGSKGGKLYAIDIDGNLRWTHSTDGFIYSSPAVSTDGNNIYVCSQDGKLYALAQDGSELWSFETAGFGVINGAIFASPAIGADGTVYIGGLYDPNLYALDPNDGSIKWVCHFSSEGWPFAPPVIAADGTIYQTLAYDPHLYAIDPNNGNIFWATNLTDIVWEVSPSRTYSYSRWFEPYYYEDVQFIWFDCADVYINAQYNVSNSGWSEPVLGPDGTIYVSFDDPWLRAVEPNGSIKWIRKIGSTSGFDLTVDNNGLIYAASDDSNLYVVNPQGLEVARFDSNDYWLSFPVISADNTVVFSDSRDNSMLINYDNNRIWAIGGDCVEEELALYWQGGAQDLDCSGTIDSIDFAILARDWLKCTACSLPPVCGPWYEQFLTGDINKDLYVDFADVAALADQWLKGY